MILRYIRILQFLLQCILILDIMVRLTKRQIIMVDLPTNSRLMICHVGLKIIRLMIMQELVLIMQELIG